MADEIALIKEKIDIVEYVGRSVPLKKAGRNFSGLCPFHTESSPSFNVSPDRQIFKCFGCGVSGDVFTYVMQREGLSFGEALKMLAEEVGVELKSRKGTTEQEGLEDRLYEMHRLAAEFYHYILLTHEIGEEGREYLEKRGIGVLVGDLKNAIGEKPEGSESAKGKEKKVVEANGDSVVERFKIGYAPKSWDALGSFLLKKGFKVEDMIKGGLVVRKAPKEGQVAEVGRRDWFDMFRGRVMFPLYDKAGRVVGFAGRVLGSEKTAKYINTAETPVFHKREFLFGYYQTKEDIRKKGEVIVTEGEMDMLSSYRVGVRNVVAVKGSALTPEQIELLGRLCQRLLLCFDADKAGDMAMRKAIQLAEEKGLEVKVIQVIGGKDPDECIKKDVGLWLESIEKAVPYYDYLMQSAVSRYGVSDAIGKKKVVQEVMPAINNIQNIIEKGHYLQRLSTIIHVSEEQLKSMQFADLGNVAESGSRVKRPAQSGEQIVRENGVVEHKVELKKSYSLGELESGMKQRQDARYKIDQNEHFKKLEWYFIALLLRLKHPILGISKKLQIEDIGDKSIKEVYTKYVDFFEKDSNKFVEDFIATAAASHLLPVIDDIFLVDVSFEDEEDLKGELFITAKHLKEVRIREEMRILSLDIKRMELEGGNEKEISRMHSEVSSLFERLGRLQRMG